MNYPRPAGLRNALPVLTLLVLCLSQTQAQTPATALPLTGKIAHITILGTKNISPDTVRAVLSLKVGDAYTPEAVAKDVAAIKNMGVFQSTITTSATTTSVTSTSATRTPTTSTSATTTTAGVVDLTYTVAENPVVTSIHFTTDAPDGKPSVPFSDLLTQMKTQVGQPLNTNVLVKDLDGLFNQTISYTVQHGHHMAVSSNININPKTGVLTIPLVEYYIKSIKITGNSRIKTADILARVHTKVGDLYDGNALQDDASSIYEMGSIRNISYGTDATQAGQINITFSVVEQAPATGVLDEKQGKVIPFLYDPITDPYPVVQVSVNGKPPLPFIIDTGTTVALTVNPWAVKELGLKMNEPVEKGVGFTYQMAPIHSVVLLGADHSKDVAFDVRSAQIVDMDFMGQAFSGSRHIAGLVGLGLLVPFTSCLDFAAQTLTVFTQPHPPLFIPKGTVLPLRVDPDNEVFTVRATLASDTYANLILDTGSTSTQLPLSALKVLHPTAMAFRSITERVEGFYVAPDLRLPSLTLGAIQVPNVTVGTLPSARTSVGLDILSRYRLTLDGPNSQLILEPSTYGKRSMTGHSGLNIKPSGNGWKVSLLEDKLPAQNSGLQVEDEIVTVGGASVKGLSLLQVGRQLSGTVGIPVQVSVRRGGMILSLSWVPVDEFSAARSAIDGLSMAKTLSGPWVITDVLKGSFADRAGLLTGDKITHINTESVINTPPSRNAELFSSSSVLLEVERAEVAKPFTVTLSVPK